MRGFRYRRRLARLLPLLLLAIVLPFIEPYTPAVLASHRLTYFSSNAQGGFEPTGIDFGFRLNVPGQFNEPRMLVTRPWDGNPRLLVQRDSDASGFSLRATLPSRPSNSVRFVDSVAAIPAVVGTQGTQVTAGGFPVNGIFVTQGLNVYFVSGAGTVPPGQTITTPFTSIPTGTGNTQCTSTTTDILVDRWALQFGGAAIVTCYGPGVFEAWKFTNAAPTPVLLTRLPELITGRADFTSPNFAGCGGCLAVTPDNTDEVILIPANGTSLTRIQLGTLTNGRRHTITVKPRVYEFGTSNGCLFGTVPSANAIRKFDCDAFPAVFRDTNPGDLLVFTSAQTVLRVSYTNHSVLEVDTGVGIYEDLAFPSLRLVNIIVQQPSVPNPNKGTDNVLFYIESSTGFNPQSDVNISTLKFGKAGSEPSVTGCNAHTGTDTNGDGVPDLKCTANLTIAQCGGPVLCIVTGFTFNQAGFAGD